MQESNPLMLLQAHIQSPTRMKISINLYKLPVSFICLSKDYILIEIRPSIVLYPLIKDPFRVIGFLTDKSIDKTKNTVGSGIIPG